MSVTDPSNAQSPDDIETYLGKVSVGSEVVIRHDANGTLRFVLTHVTEISDRRGRFYTSERAHDGGRAWYLKTGKNCAHPRGASRLVVPTLQVRDFISRHPHGIPHDAARPDLHDLSPARRRARGRR